MKKMFSKVSAAAMSAALILGNGVLLGAYASEADATTETTTTTAAAEITTTTTTVAATEATTTTTTVAESTTTTVAVTAADQGAFTGTFYATSAKYSGFNTYSFSSDGKSGSFTNSVTGTATAFTAQYTNGAITISFNGGTKTGTLSNITGTTSITGFTVTWSDGEVETFTTSVPTVTTTTAAAASTTTTTSATGSATSASTTKAVTTTAKQNKNDSPKTGDSFPALAMTAALVSAASLSLITKKRNK